MKVFCGGVANILVLKPRTSMRQEQNVSIELPYISYRLIHTIGCKLIVNKGLAIIWVRCCCTRWGTGGVANDTTLIVLTLQQRRGCSCAQVSRACERMSLVLDQSAVP